MESVTVESAAMAVPGMRHIASLYAKRRTIPFSSGQ
jgi:hypothetical protein